MIDEWPVPKNLHEVQSFIGMCSYYRRFIAKFSIIAGPLHDLTKKKVKFQWTLKEHTAFITLKQRLLMQPLLKLLDLEKTLRFTVTHSVIALVPSFLKRDNQSPMKVADSIPKREL